MIRAQLSFLLVLRYGMFLLLLLPVSILNAQESGRIYEDEEIKIVFDTMAVRHYQTWQKYTKFKYRKVIRYRETSKYTHPGQGIMTNDPFLCYIFIMPSMSVSTTKRKAMRGWNRKLSKYDMYTREDLLMELKEVNGHQVFSWHYRYGKTRLDHFMVFGKKNSYLFVSSPYGAIEEESLIENIEWK